jgi:hypothetical protein
MATNFSAAVRGIPGATAQILSTDPLIVVFDNALSDAEIDMMIEKATPLFERSKVAGPNGGLVPDESRTSDTAWLYGSEDERVMHLKGRNHITGARCLSRSSTYFQGDFPRLQL